MSYHHLTITERIKIETYLELGLKPSHIAKKLEVNRSTISRELKRCQGTYSAESAQKHYNQRAKHKGRKSICTPNLKYEIESQLKASWSPEQISGRYQREQRPMVSFKTIYNWLYKGLISCDLTVLRRKGKSRQPRETRGKFTIGTPISKRPKEVKKRESVGHWELDTVVSSRGKSKGCLATFVENLGIDFYFADAYSSWQRGSNENSNGLLREYFPKKTDLALISDEDLFSALFAINHRPRKCLGYRTSFEALLSEL